MMLQDAAELRTKSLLSIVVICIMLGVIASWSLKKTSTTTHATTYLSGVTDQDVTSLTLSIQNTEPMTVYLPMVERSFPPPPSQFGVQMQAITESHGLTRVVEAKVYWVRFAAFQWDQIEPERTDPPTYHWDKVDEESLRNAALNGLQVIATVQFTPEWAQKIRGVYCGPIAEDALDEFAQFMQALVRRYSIPPYNVHYWELGNEPDVDPSLVSEHSVFGCWGDQNDEYYGGGYYAEMLKVVYPAIKEIDPEAQVLIGGLLLDCDPTNPPEGKDCRPARFLEGILRNDGGDYFDIVSFHGYASYNGSLYMDEHYPSWDARGGGVLGKISFLREVMANYGIDKPLLHTEGALLCPPEDTTHCDPPDNSFYEAQADYVIWLFVRNWAADLMGTTWYPFEGPGWRYSGMLDATQEPKPVYWAFQFMTQELRSTSYQGQVSQYPDLRGYEFTTSSKRIWVLWSPDEQPHLISLPTNVTHVYDKYGQGITFSDTITVESPIYVELRP